MPKFAKGTVIYNQLKLDVSEIDLEIIYNEQISPIPNKLLNGEISIKGTLINVCQPSESKITTGRVWTLKVYLGNKFSTLQVLFIEPVGFGTVYKQSAYKWLFYGVARASVDQLELLPSTDIEDLIAELGGRSNEVCEFNSEGGFINK